MQAVILAGGLGTRLSEETSIRPKPMVEIGSHPILWHIMKIYSHHGINDFIICCGYKGYAIKEYFANYYIHNQDITVETAEQSIRVHKRTSESWKVTLVDTGADTMTGGRLKRVADYINGTFCFTYGDGLADIDISGLISEHYSSGALATLTAVKPPGRFGVLRLSGTYVQDFVEKPDGDGSWINGGFFVLDPKVIDLIDGDHTVWEDQPLKSLAKSGSLRAFRHEGFWHPMDTLRDCRKLNQMWAINQAPWKVWP